MTDEQLKNLRKLAEAATQGVWTVDEKKGEWYGVESTADPQDWVVCGDDSDYPRPTKVNAHYIAAANPATMLALLNKVDQLNNNLLEAINYLLQGKAQFAPHTTNSLVDSFLEKMTGVSSTKRGNVIGNHPVGACPLNSNIHSNACYCTPKRDI